MCGLASFSGFKDKKANPMILKFLLLYNEDRGNQALGIYSKETGIVKKQGKPRDLLTKEEFKIPVTNQFIGHVRAASSGGDGDARAHPFQQGNIILAMNGTLSNHYALCNEYKIDTQPLWVDSDFLCAMLNKTQNKEPLSKIDGGCACVYIDNITDKMYVYRNVERPLFKGFLEEGMYISSTKESLEAVGCAKIKEFEQDRLYEIVNGSAIKTYQVKRYIKPVVLPKTVVYDDFISYYDKEINKMYKQVELCSNNKDKLIGLWLQPKTDFIVASGVSFYKNRRYQVCTDVYYTSPVQFSVFDPITNKIVVAPMVNFSNRIPVLEKNDYVFAVKDIILDNNKLFCKKGHLLCVDDITTNKYVTRVDVRIADGTDDCYFVKDCYEFIRWATDSEAEEWWSTYQIQCLLDTYKDEDRVDQLPVVAKLLPPANRELTFLEKYAKKLDGKKLETYEELISVFLKELNEGIDDLESMGVDSFTEQVIEKMKIAISYFKKCDEAWMELYGNDKTVDYGG